MRWQCHELLTVAGIVMMAAAPLLAFGNQDCGVLSAGLGAFSVVCAGVAYMN